jgi:hypothetical protein
MTCQLPADWQLPVHEYWNMTPCQCEVENQVATHSHRIDHYSAISTVDLTKSAVPGLSYSYEMAADQYKAHTKTIRKEICYE